MRPLVILNPAAGRGLGRAWRARVVRAMQAQGWAPELVETAEPGHATDLARQAVGEGWTHVIAVGGDGTVHEVANGLLVAEPAEDGATAAALGVVPIGTGNDFARLVRLRPGPPERSVALLVGARPCSFDVGRVGTEYFVNGMGAGFDAEVVRRANRMTGLRGITLYLTAACRTFVTFRPVTMRIDADEFHETGPMTLVEVSIGRSGGGGFLFSPDADPTDGLLDVCVIREVSLLQFAIKVPAVIRGTHGGMKEVSQFRTRAIRIATDDAPLHLHLDGEFRAPRARELGVTIEPARLRVLRTE